MIVMTECPTEHNKKAICNKGYACDGCPDNPDYKNKGNELTMFTKKEKEQLMKNIREIIPTKMAIIDKIKKDIPEFNENEKATLTFGEFVEMYAEFIKFFSEEITKGLYAYDKFIEMKIDGVKVFWENYKKFKETMSDPNTDMIDITGEGSGYYDNDEGIFEIKGEEALKNLIERKSKQKK